MTKQLKIRIAQLLSTICLFNIFPFLFVLIIGDPASFLRYTTENVELFILLKLGWLIVSISIGLLVIFLTYDTRERHLIAFIILYLFFIVLFQGLIIVRHSVSYFIGGVQTKRLEFLRVEENLFPEYSSKYSKRTTRNYHILTVGNKRFKTNMNAFPELKECLNSNFLHLGYECKVPVIVTYFNDRDGLLHIQRISE